MKHNVMGRGAAALALVVSLLGAAPARSGEVVDQDLVIPKSEISETAKFYDVTINGTTLEVVAVKAPDGTIRTAFNTCQSCRSFFTQSGNTLVCRSCGQKFRLGSIGIASGGCNPVPIEIANRRDSDDSITIPREYLATKTEWQKKR